MKIKYSFDYLRKAIFVFSLFLMVAVSCFLYYEYSFFKEQSSKLIELQDDYRTYIGAVNKILIDYNKVKEKIEEQSLSFDNKNNNEKKKDIDQKNIDQVDSILFYDDFPKGAQIFSSDEFCQESFFVLNRDLNYLRDSALGFINNQDDYSYILDGIDWSDWCEYTDYGLSKISVSDKIQKRAKEFKGRPRKIKRAAPKIKKSKKVSSYARLNSRVRKGIGVKNRKGIKLSWPIKRSRFWISSLYGPRKKCSGAWGFHYGVDMASLKGTPVCAAYTGIVVEARYASGYGNTIVIAHNRQYRSRYAHLSKILVSVGQKVKQGNVIGKVGDSGYVRSSKGRDASHLHFELVDFGKKVNPLRFIES